MGWDCLTLLTYKKYSITDPAKLLVVETKILMRDLSNVMSMHRDKFTPDLSEHLKGGTKCLGSGRGSVGRAVASYTWGLRFESSHQTKSYVFLLSTFLKWQCIPGPVVMVGWLTFFRFYSCKNCKICLKSLKINKKRPGVAHFKTESSVRFVSMQGLIKLVNCVKSC